MGKKDLIKRLRWYYPLEKLHAFFTFPALTVYFLATYPFLKSISFCYGMLVCIFILYQGQKYWQLKLWRLERKPFPQPKNLRFFRKAKRINHFLILGIPLVFILQFLIADWSSQDSGILFFTIVANVFAVLEHINYYHTQLMVDNAPDLHYIIHNKKLKAASLAKDLKENSI